MNERRLKPDKKIKIKPKVKEKGMVGSVYSSGGKNFEAG